MVKGKVLTAAIYTIFPRLVSACSAFQKFRTLHESKPRRIPFECGKVLRSGAECSKARKDDLRELVHAEGSHAQLRAPGLPNVGSAALMRTITSLQTQRETVHLPITIIRFLK